MNYRNFIPLLAAGADPALYGVAPDSVHRSGDAAVFMAEDGGEILLIAVGRGLKFEGEILEADGIPYIAAPLNRKNACALRRLFPFLTPSPVLSSGGLTLALGDFSLFSRDLRQALEKEGITPVFTRNWAEGEKNAGSLCGAVDAAIFAAFRNGYTGGFGTLCEGISTLSGAEEALKAGYASVMLDAGGFVRQDAECADRQAESGYPGEAWLHDRYPEKIFDVGRDIVLAFNYDDVKQAALKFGGAIDMACGIYNVHFANGKSGADFALSFEALSCPVTPEEHFFIANELKSRRVKLAAFAPGIGKGGAGAGSLSEDLEAHAAVCETLGHKLAVTLGEDGFSLYPAVKKLTKGRSHIKISGPCPFPAEIFWGDREGAP